MKINTVTLFEFNAIKLVSNFLKWDYKYFF